MGTTCLTRPERVVLAPNEQHQGLGLGKVLDMRDELWLHEDGVAMGNVFGQFLSSKL